MSRTVKMNEVPTAPFSLRESGPLALEELQRKLKGRAFRLATHHQDTKATVDPTPCPHCHSLVEWTPTSSKVGSKIVRYVYARCRGDKAHAWSFRNVRPSPPVIKPENATQAPPKPVDVTLPPRPSVGGQILTRWIETRLAELEDELRKLGEIRRLANEVSHRGSAPTLPASWQSPEIPKPRETKNGH